MGTGPGGAVDIVQTTSYYPFGLVMSQMNGNTSTGYAKNKYLYNGKELQDDVFAGSSLNWFDYGARFYDPQIGRFTTMDPMANKYYRWNPYCYVLNNPLKYIDSDGRLVEFAPGSSQEFKNKVAATINYMNTKGTSGFFNSLSESKSVYILQETKGGVNTFASNTISWNPNLAKITTEGVILSPATLLNHELDHANQSDSKPDQFKKDADLTTGKNTQYDTNEEERVIEGSEQETAKKHGEIKDGEVTRKDHKMIGSVQVEDPTSTGIPSVNIVGNKKDADNTQSTQKKKDEKDQ
jgi:RHS repeat-associated protein